MPEEKQKKKLEVLPVTKTYEEREAIGIHETKFFSLKSTDSKIEDIKDKLADKVRKSKLAPEQADHDKKVWIQKRMRATGEFMSTGEDYTQATDSFFQAIFGEDIYPEVKKLNEFTGGKKRA